MKIVLLVFACVAVAYSKPSALLAPVAYAAPLVYGAPLAVSSQYHSQDSLGQYHYGYANGLSSKAETKSADGVTRGGYTYVDAEGKLQSVQYTSDAVHGFRVAASNLPLAPQVEAAPLPAPTEDTAEVAAAKAAHLAAVESAKIKTVEAAPVTDVVAAAPVVPSFQTYTYEFGAPLAYGYGYPAVAAYAAPWVAAPSVLINAAPATPVDTPEVAQAKAEHLAAVEEVKARS